MNLYSSSFQEVMELAFNAIDEAGVDVTSGRWQGIDTGVRPDFITREFLNFPFVWQMPRTQQDLARAVRPDLPWAEDHFQERICGFPMNPGKAYKDWPWHGTDADKFLNSMGQFDISYMERIWPPPLSGIRYEYGGLDSLIHMLVENPGTRQAYLPLFFPEDTGRTVGRTMCSLGYHFMIRQNELHMWYHLRSCDFVRHFCNDVYMAARLAQYVVEQLYAAEGKRTVSPGNMYFAAYSFHVHHGDWHFYESMRKEWGIRAPK